MSFDSDLLVPGAFALLGVLVGGWVNGRAESSKWRRDYLIARIEALRVHFAEIVEAVDAQLVLNGQIEDLILGRRNFPIPADRTDAVRASWARLFSLKTIHSPPDLQHAIVAFDQARNVAALAANSLNAKEMRQAIVGLETAHTTILEEIGSIIDAMNHELVPLLVKPHVRFWRRLTRKSMFI